MSSVRASGILLHPTSFPSPFGIGDLGINAYQFIDFLKESCQQYWQILPLGPTGFGNSPYMCYSAIAGNPLLISPEKLKHKGFLVDTDFIDLPEFSEDRVDYELVIKTKIPLLQKACTNFKNNANPEQQQAFTEFCQSKAYWLDDYALFMALKEHEKSASWHYWKPELSKRKQQVIEAAKLHLVSELFYHKFLQYEFFHQWSELKQYANEAGIHIIGDMPIYVAHDSADVWANPDIFCLDEETGEAKLMAGVPPDYFSITGQFWGNPVYNWEELEKQDFQWWIQRFESTLDYVDIIRIDHFRGFQAYWAIPKGEETAINGKWIQAPGERLFSTIRNKIGKLPVLAEDLGFITPEVVELRNHFDFPGMKVLHFAFGSNPDNPFLPFNLPRNCIMYTGTHDNDTTIGWFEQISDYELYNLLTYIGCISPDGVHWDLIRLALTSVADQTIIPLQDIFGLGSQARMNFPGKTEGNWEWRYQQQILIPEISEKLRNLTKLCGRAQQ